MDFEIDTAFLTDKTVFKEHRVHQDKTEVSPDELVEMLKSSSTIVSRRSVDHPEFTRLRDQLESAGYISCERRWWNGDRVLKEFRLNGVLFQPGDQFHCAAAMKFFLQVSARRRDKDADKFDQAIMKDEYYDLDDKYSGD